MKLLQDVTSNLKPPISRTSIDGKVEVFERRLNSKILPFVGLHGLLISLFYLINSAELSLFPLSPPSHTLFAVSIACFGLATFYLQQKNLTVAGVVAAAFILAITASLMLPFGNFGVLIALTLFLLLLWLNTTKLADNYEANTVFIYLPLIFFGVRDISGSFQLVSAIVLFGSAIYVKFYRQPESNKMPLGFGMLVFLSLVIEDNTDAKVLVATLVGAALILFIVYAFRNRHATGSSYRHFVGDAIPMGLWAALVAVPELKDSYTYILWGVGVVCYQGVALFLLNKQSGGITQKTFEREARLAWLQIAVFYITITYVQNVFVTIFDIDNDIFFLPALLILSPFIPLYRYLKSPFLALSTRLGIALCLTLAAEYAWDTVDSLYNSWDLQSIHTGVSFEISWTAFAFFVGLTATLRTNSTNNIAWWRGLIRARHMVMIRRTGRLVVANANRIAFVGGIISAVVGLFNWMRYAGGKQQGVGSRDLLLIGIHVYAVTMTILFCRYLVGVSNVETKSVLNMDLLSFSEEEIVYVFAWCLWGTVLYLYGVLFKDCLARFFATGFVLMPAVMFSSNNFTDNKIFLAETALICCFSLFSFGLFRRIFN